MTTATAWRFTAGGRPLIDRRRRSRAARNLSLVTEYLEKLGVEPGEIFLPVFVSESKYKNNVSEICDHTILGFNVLEQA